MANVYFSFRSKVNDPETLLSIWARIRNGRTIDIRIPTGLKIQSKYWDKKKERPKNYTGTNKDLALYLSDIDSKLTSLWIKLCEGAMTHHDDFTKSMAVSIVEKIVSGETASTNGIPKDVNKYCRMVIDQMQKGIRTIATDGRSTTKGKGKKYSDSTIKSWNTFATILDEYAKDHPLSWDEISEIKLADFKEYMAGHGYMNATQNKFIRTFKAMAGMAQDDGVHVMDPKVYRTMSREDEKSSDTKTTKVYLTDAEIEALYNMPLAPGSKKDRVRDLFCMGCYIGQRVSDYNHLSPEMFKKSAYGHDIVCLKQQKTGHEITIPILNPHAMDIVKKYDYNMPSVSDVIINRYIKEICKTLSESVPSLNNPIVSTLCR